jgi:L-aspartate oxidase
MASNSLLECLVFARAAAEAITASLDRGRAEAFQAPSPPGGAGEVEPGRIAERTDAIRRLMWRYAGIVRSVEGLRQAAAELAPLAAAIERSAATSRLTPDLIELRNLATVAELIVRSALQRRESRGLHYIVDYPELDPAQAHDTVLTPQL